MSREESNKFPGHLPDHPGRDAKCVCMCVPYFHSCSYVHIGMYIHIHVDEAVMGNSVATDDFDVVLSSS